MVMRLLTTETSDELVVERAMYTRRYALVLDKKRCVGCDVCQTVCPREAVQAVKPAKVEGQELGRPMIMIDEAKCSFCGICSAICPFGAFSLTMNGERINPVLEKESFPRIVHEIEVDQTKCPVDCDECEKACPFNLIEVSADKSKGVMKIEIDKEHCPGCRLCEVKCPEAAVRVKKIVSGSIKIDQEKCPSGCHDCADVCPIPGVLYILDDGKVGVDDYCCIYCGVCKVVCPVEEALGLRRSAVLHTPVHSGAWNKALEKLASTNEMAKELTSRRAVKVRESARRRVG